MFKGAELRKFLSPQPRQTEKVFVNLSTSTSKKNLARSKDDDNIDALCVNCQEMININIIDQHSQVCYKVTEKSFQIDNELNNEQIDFKLARLKKALQSQLNSQHIVGITEKNMRLQLIDCIEKVLKFNQKSDLKQIRMLKDLLGGIHELSNNFQRYPSLLLYLERVNVLGQEKYRDLIKNDQEAVCNWKDQLNIPQNKVSSKNTLETYNNENTPSSNDGFKAVTHYSLDDGYNLQPKVFNPSTRLAVAGTHRNFQEASRDSEIFNKNAKLQKNQSSGNIASRIGTYFDGAQLNENLTANQSPSRFSRNGNEKSSQVSSPIKDYINFHPFFQQKENNESRGSLPMNIGSNIRNRIEISNSTNKLIDDELRMSLPTQNFFSKNNPGVYISPLINRDRNIATENVTFSKSEQKNLNMYNSPEKDIHKDSFMSSSYLSNMISVEHCSPSQRYRNCDNSEQRSLSRDSIKLDLEQKLEMKKKELEKVTSLVKKYKHRTATIQISLNDSNLSNKDELQLRGRTSLKMGQSQSATKPGYRGSAEFENLGKGGNQDYLLHKTQENESFEEKLSINSLKFNQDTSLDEYNRNSILEEVETEENTEQRIFYSKCLGIKMKFKNNAISQHIPIGLIYKDAIKNNVPQSHWDRFIDNAFVHPERYVDAAKLQKKKKQSQGLQNRLIEIAQNKASINKNNSLIQLQVFSS